MKKTVQFYVYNIKLQTKKTGDVKRKEYIRIISALSNAKIFFQVRNNEAITMYSSYGGERDEKPEYIYGRASKGMYIPGEEVNSLKDGKVTKQPNDPERIIGPKTVDYIFIPDIHRLALQKANAGPSYQQFEAFLRANLPKIVDKNDLIEIVLEKDSSVIKEIFTAKSVHSLSYKISYTNDDLVGVLGDELDEQLKSSNIGDLSVTAKADNLADGLNIEQSIILKGGLELAERNGEIRNAVIVPEGIGARKKTVSNKDRPQIQFFEDEDQGDKWRRWARKILSVYTS